MNDNYYYVYQDDLDRWQGGARDPRSTRNETTTGGDMHILASNYHYSVGVIRGLDAREADSDSKSLDVGTTCCTLFRVYQSRCLHEINQMEKGSSLLVRS